MKPSKKEFRPIAMLCNQEQFDRIKPKLEGHAFITFDTLLDFNNYPYLINNYVLKRGNIGNNSCPKEQYRTVHETWNEEIFLNACCIETEFEFETFTVNRTGKGDLYVDGIKYVPENKESYTITKQQIWDMDNFGYGKAREWFPEMFKEQEVIFNEPILSLNDLLSVWNEDNNIELYKKSPLFNAFKIIAEEKLLNKKIV